MDTIKPNQGTPKRREVYNLLKANPELADQLLKLFDDAYNQLMDGYEKITNDFLKSHPEFGDGYSPVSTLQDFLCETMEDGMQWPNLTALPYKVPNNPITEEEREAWIREISSIDCDYWAKGQDGKCHKFDKFGNQLD